MSRLLCAAYIPLLVRDQCRQFVSCQHPAPHAVALLVGARHTSPMARPDETVPAPFWWLFYKLSGWVALVFLIPCLIMVGISAFSFSMAKRFDENGLETTARIEQLYFEETTDSDNDTVITYYLDLTYQTRDGAQMALTQDVTEDVFERSEKGASMQIWYLADDPDTIEVTRGDNLTLGRVTRVIAIVLGLIAGSIAVFIGWRTLDAIRARRSGKIVTGKVLRIARSAWEVNGTPRYRVVWQERGGPEGYSLLYKQDEIQGLSIGSEITLYKGRKYAWWRGDVGPRKTP